MLGIPLVGFPLAGDDFVVVAMHLGLLVARRLAATPTPAVVILGLPPFLPDEARLRSLPPRIPVGERFFICRTREKKLHCREEEKLKSSTPPREPSGDVNRELAENSEQQTRRNRKMRASSRTPLAPPTADNRGRGRAPRDSSDCWVLLKEQHPTGPRAG